MTYARQSGLGLVIAAAVSSGFAVDATAVPMFEGIVTQTNNASPITYTPTAGTDSVLLVAIQTDGSGGFPGVNLDFGVVGGGLFDFTLLASTDRTAIFGLDNPGTAEGSIFFGSPISFPTNYAITVGTATGVDPTTLVTGTSSGVTGDNQQTVTLSSLAADSLVVGSFYYNRGGDTGASGFEFNAVDSTVDVDALFSGATGVNPGSMAGVVGSTVVPTAGSFAAIADIDPVTSGSTFQEFGVAVGYAPIPEPASLVLLGAGSLMFLRRRG